MVISFAGPVLFVAMVLLASPLVWLGLAAGDLARLAVNRDLYETIIAENRTTTRAVSSEDRDDVRYRVDAGPPIRVAFNPEGLLNNWSGIVFDPTGEVMLADGLDLFGGNLVGCRHLWDSYYKCSFS